MASTKMTHKLGGDQNSKNLKLRGKKIIFEIDG